MKKFIAITLSVCLVLTGVVAWNLIPNNPWSFWGNGSHDSPAEGVGYEQELDELLLIRTYLMSEFLLSQGRTERSEPLVPACDPNGIGHLRRGGDLRLPVLLDEDNYCVDQYGFRMRSDKAAAFLELCPAYAEVFVAANDYFCPDEENDLRNKCLDAMGGYASRRSHVPNQFIDYDWMLEDLPSDHDQDLEEFRSYLAASGVDCDEICYDTAIRIVGTVLARYRAEGDFLPVPPSRGEEPCD